MTASIYHMSRTWSGTDMEDECPCPQEPCGMVASNRTDPTCVQHPPERTKSMRRMHEADACPAVEAVSA